MAEYTLIKAMFEPNYPVCKGVIIVAVPDEADPLTMASLKGGAKMLGSYKALATLEFARVVGILSLPRPELFKGLPGREDCKVIHFEDGEY